MPIAKPIRSANTELLFMSFKFFQYVLAGEMKLGRGNAFWPTKQKTVKC